MLKFVPCQVVLLCRCNDVTKQGLNSIKTATRFCFGWKFHFETADKMIMQINNTGELQISDAFPYA